MVRAGVGVRIPVSVVRTCANDPATIGTTGWQMLKIAIGGFVSLKYKAICHVHESIRFNRRSKNQGTKPALNLIGTKVRPDGSS